MLLLFFPQNCVHSQARGSGCSGFLDHILEERLLKSLGFMILLKIHSSYYISSVQSLSRDQLFVTPRDCSAPGLPVYHQLPELSQTHVHRVGDAIQPSHPLSSPSPPAPVPHKKLILKVSEIFKIL